MVATLRMNGWINYPWAEYTTRSGVTREAAFSYEGGCQATFTILINWTDTVPVVLEILGGARYNRTTGNLDRTLPVRHPEFDWLYASKITSVKPMRWDSKLRLPYGTLSGYQYSIITIVFTQPKWTMLSDPRLDSVWGSPRKEYRRFVERRPEPSGEVLTRKNNTFKWAETGASGPTVGDPINESLGQFLAKSTEVLVWKRVPQVGLFSNFGFGDPTNVLASQGTVNNAEFLGKPAGTLLLLPPRFVPLEVPTIPAAVGANENLGQPAIFYDVELPMLYFNPDAGSTTRGHNLAPYPNGKWYKVVDALTETFSLFPQTDFATIFTMTA